MVIGILNNLIIDLIACSNIFEVRTSNLVMHTRAFNCSCLSLDLWIWCMSIPMDYYSYSFNNQNSDIQCKFRSQMKCIIWFPLKFGFENCSIEGLTTGKTTLNWQIFFWISRLNIYCSRVIKNNVSSNKYGMIIAILLRYFVGLKPKWSSL